MNRAYVPQAVLDAAHARSAARVERRWEEADRLRDEIEAAGWRVIDSGTNFRLELAGRPDAVDEDGIRYGSSASVPSRMDEPVQHRASIVMIATHAWPLVGRALEAVLATRDERDEVVVVIDGPDALMAPLPVRIPADCAFVRTTTPLGSGAALNIALRRATGEVMVLLGPGLEPTGDLVSPLVAALGDPDVVVAGRQGFRTRDLRRLVEVILAGDATVISGEVLAFRRADGLAAMPVDEFFVSPHHLDRWWSLTLRGATDPDGSRPPGRARVVADLPLRRTSGDVIVGPASDAVRLERRNFYRMLNAFRDREDLLAEVSDT